jgi:hypothetical protein
MHHRYKKTGGYRYRNTRKRSLGSRRKSIQNKSRQSGRSRSMGLSLARGFKGGNSMFNELPTGYSVGGMLNPFNSALANPPIINGYSSCNSTF